MVGPTVYTCLRCSAEWPVVFLAIGQLAPWSFKMLNDGFQSYKKSPTKKTRDKFYLIIGSFTTPVLTILGWVGFSTLSFYVREHWMWVIFVGGLVVPPLVIGVIWMSCGGELESATFCRMVLTIMLFIVASFHIVGSDILLARLTNNWSGLASTGAGLTSSIIFFVAKRIVFLVAT